MPISVEIVTQEKIVFSEPEADMVIIPGSEGEMGVLPHHAPGADDARLWRTGRAQGAGGRELRHLRRRGRYSPGSKSSCWLIWPNRRIDIDVAAVEAARERAEKMMEQGVPPEQNREAALALRRAELALRIQRKVQSRGSAVMRIVEDERARVAATAFVTPIDNSNARSTIIVRAFAVWYNCRVNVAGHGGLSARMSCQLWECSTKNWALIWARSTS